MKLTHTPGPTAHTIAIEGSVDTVTAPELEMGRTIQTSVLPTALSPDPRFRLAAAMRTAKEVGGDFYDFFPLPGDRLALLIADVSGKGITAALYMMNAKALLKARILAHPEDPSLALAEANQTLCANNQAHMFITVFLAILHLPTGTLTTLNAGHNPPPPPHPRRLGLPPRQTRPRPRRLPQGQIPRIAPRPPPRRPPPSLHRRRHRGPKSRLHPLRRKTPSQRDPIRPRHPAGHPRRPPRRHWRLCLHRAPGRRHHPPHRHL